MNSIRFIFAIVMALSVLTIIHASEKKTRSTNLFRERLLDLLLEAKRRGLLHNQYKESVKELQTSDDNSYNTEESDEDRFGRQFVRRKVVGISDNPF